MGCIQAHPPGSFEISKWINFIDRFAVFNRNAGDETTLTLYLPRRFEFSMHVVLLKCIPRCNEVPMKSYDVDTYKFGNCLNFFSNINHLGSS